MFRGIFILMLLALLSCNKDKIEKPDNLIPRDKMISLLTDLTLYTSAEGMNKTTLREYGISSDQFVYEKHDVDSIQFKESNRYYSYDVSSYQKMFDEVKARLKAKKSELAKIDKAEQNERKKQDSIRRAKILKKDSTKIKTIDQDSAILSRVKTLKRIND